MWGGGWGYGCGWGGNNNVTSINNNNFVNNSNRQNINGGNRVNRGNRGGTAIGNTTRSTVAELLTATEAPPIGTAVRPAATRCRIVRRMRGRIRLDSNRRAVAIVEPPNRSQREHPHTNTGCWGQLRNRDMSNRGNSRSAELVNVEPRQQQQPRRKSTSPEYSQLYQPKRVRWSRQRHERQWGPSQQFARLFQYGWVARRWGSRGVGPEGAGRKAHHDERGKHEYQEYLFRQMRFAVSFALMLVVAVLCIAGLAAGQAQPADELRATGPKAFDTPQQAADALIKAAGDYDVPELMAILGPDGQDFVASDDPVQDKNNAALSPKRPLPRIRSQLASPIQTGPPSSSATKSGRCRSLWRRRWQVVLQRQSRTAGDSLSAHWGK